jgi:hypothetical protein
MVGGLGLGLLIASMLPACSSSSNTPATETSTGGSESGGGANQSGGTSTGGSANQSGGTQNATGGTDTGGTPNATGGTDTGGTPNATGGTDTGGSLNGTGGTDTGGTATGGTGGVDCNPPKTVQCTGTVPPAALISDFAVPDSGSPTVFGTWGQSVFGGTYVYPATPSNPNDPCAGTAPQYPLTTSTSGENWHITGQVGTYSGGGLWFSCNTGTSAAPTYVTCTIDASAYTGISFTVSGTGGPLSVLVQDPASTKPTTDSAGGSNNCGTCTASTCGTSVSVPVSTSPTTVTLTWAQLGVTNPAAITQISFSLPDPYSYATNPPVATPYSVDITIDDLQFTT